MRIHWQSLFLCLAVTCCPGYHLATSPLQAQSAGPTPLVLAFYYNWYDENTWTPDKINDLPLEPYASRDRAAMVRQVEQAQSAGIDAFIVSWYGPTVENNQTEPNFSVLLDVAQERGFKAAVDFETASPFINGQAETVAALQHLLNVHAPRESYLKADGRPVVFFWAIDRVSLASGQTSALQAWRAIRQQVDPNRTSLWIAEGVDIKYQEVFDGHHLYNIAWANSVSRSLSDWGNRVRKWAADNGQPRLWVATVMPGWNDLKTGRASAYVRDRKNGQFYEESWQAAIASRPDWIIITSFNEWIENSYIEPSQNYGNLYLDLTRKWAERFKSGPAAVEAAPIMADRPTPVPLPTDTPTPVPPPTDTPTPVPLPTDTPAPVALSMASAQELATATVVRPTPASIAQVRQLPTDAEEVRADATATAAPVYGEVMDSKVPLRDGPGREFRVIGLLHNGFVVQIVGSSPDGDWLKVITPTGETGYAEAEFIEQKPDLTPASPPLIVVTSPPIPQVGLGPSTGELRTGTVITGTKLRKGPSSDFGPAARVEAGETFELITTNLDGSWYQVRLSDGQEGWIMAYRTRLLEPTATALPVLSPIAIEKTAPTVPPAPETTASPTATVSPTPSPMPQIGLTTVLSEDSPYRGQTLLGVVLLVAGIGVFLIAVGLGVMHFTSQRAR